MYAVSIIDMTWSGSMVITVIIWCYVSIITHHTSTLSPHHHITPHPIPSSYNLRSMELGLGLGLGLEVRVRVEVRVGVRVEVRVGLGLGWVSHITINIAYSSIPRTCQWAVLQFI
jgi:hypothetical protein